jgi:tetratricopeptide (TPR) repeat protein
MGDAPSIYNEVAVAIAEETDISLSSEEITHFTNVQPVNPEAYEAYLIGMGHLYSASRQGMDRALEYFNLSLEKDPRYARAYLGVSLVWGFRAQMGYISFKEATSHSDPAAKIAIELDSSDSEIHYMLAIGNTWGKWNWEEAEKEFIKTIELNENHAEARAYYAFYLNIMQRFDESSPQIEKAMELEPFNPIVQSLYGMHLNHTRQFEEALERLTRTLEEDPGNPIALPALWTIYHNKGLFKEAYETAREVYMAKGEVKTAEKLTESYKEGGYKVAMESVAEAYILKKDTAYVTPWQIATLYTRADNRVKALHWLEQAFRENDVNMPAISCDPIFDLIQDEPRFQTLLVRMGLTRSSVAVLSFIQY